MQEFLKYVYSNVKYPNRRACIEGRVFVTFVVEENGNITDIRSIKPLGYGLDKEVIRVIKAYPQVWEPARRNGKPARQRFQIPIRFCLTR